MVKHKKYFFKALFISTVFLLLPTINANATDANISTKSIHTFPFSENGAMSITQIKNTKDGGFIITGYSNSQNIGFENKGKIDAIIIKCDKYYDIQWKNSFGGSNNDYFNSVVELSNGEFVSVGYSNSTDAGFENKGGYDATIIKYDKDGKQKCIESFGGNYRDEFLNIIAIEDNSFFTVGSSQSSDAGFENAGLGDALLIKYNKDCNQEWIRNWGYTNTYAQANDIIRTSTNKYIVTGTFPSVLVGGSDDNKMVGALIEINSLGEQVILNHFSNMDTSEFSSMIEYSKGGFVCAGQYRSLIDGDVEYKGGTRDALIAKFDEDNNLEWYKTLGGDAVDMFKRVIELSNGDILVIGRTNSTENGLVSKGSEDVMFAIYSREGEEKCVRTFGGSKNEAIFSVLEVDGNIVFNVNSNSPEITGGNTTTVSVHYNYEYEYIFDKLELLEELGEVNQIKSTRESVNNMPEGIFKEHFQERLNNIDVNLFLERKIATGNIDIYIKSKNTLIMTLSTNSITFEDFSGAEDVLIDDAVEIGIDSSLPYNLNAYLVTEIQNADKSQTMNKEILQLKDDSEVNYQYFNNVDEKITLKSDCSAGNDKVHLIDFKLKGGIAHQKDIYKTVIKFEAEQK